MKLVTQVGIWRFRGEWLLSLKGREAQQRRKLRRETPSHNRHKNGAGAQGNQRAFIF